MPRRASTRSALPATSNVYQTSDNHSTPNPLPDDLVLLRSQWKWAAFSQFCFTFSELLAIDDVTLNNIEDDLVHGLNLYLPRIIVRLLFTLTYDRKINVNNWQTALRRQYNKRDPAANPIGPEPLKENSNSRYTSVIAESVTPEPQTEHPDPNTDNVPRSSTVPRHLEPEDESKVKPEVDDSEQSSKPPESLNEGVEQIETEQQETKDWLTLPMLDKLDSLHLLTEWQFQNPTRLRQLMKSDDEQASWRIEPIGYDAKRNAYWLIGADRLWIQRIPPKAPRSTANKSLKRKRGAVESSSKRQTKSSRTSSSHKRPRLQNKGKSKGSIPTARDSPATGRRGRAAKAQANLKLDAQAKELAELNRQAAVMSRSGSSTRSSRRQQTTTASPSKPSPRGGTRSRPLGTRLSARLRGTEEEEWQAVPEEWLNGQESDDDINATSSRSPRKTGLESDKSSVSDLTELSDEDEEDDQANGEAEDDEDEADASTEPGAEPDSEYAHQNPETPEDFIEWETICVTLYEWEHIAERWQNATHYAEKALYKVLTNHIVPIVTEELREIENKRRMEDAVVHRKRSSRLAVKELEKEEAKAVARKKAEEDERLGRQRRAEARAQREEVERNKREQAREQRRKEREAKEEATTAAENAEEQAQSEDIDVGAPPVQNTRKRAPVTSSTNRWSTGRSNSSDWEVHCEICHRQGINIDDGVPMMSCGMCSKWQHIGCHDRADDHAGRMRRDWKKIDFYCLRCRERAAMNGSRGHHQQHPVLLQPVNPHPSLGMSLTSNNGAASPYTHMAYGQSSSSTHGSGPHNLTNGYAHGDYRLSNLAKSYQTTSDIRSSTVPNAQLPYSANPSMKQISFSHYQPQQHGFSSLPTKTPLRQQASYGSSSQVQAYSQESLTAHNQYAQYANGSMNGQTQRYSQHPITSSNPLWNGNTAQTMNYSSRPSYAASAERSSAVQASHPQEIPQQQQYRPQQWMSYNHNNAQSGNMGYTSYQHPS